MNVLQDLGKFSNTHWNIAGIFIRQLVEYTAVNCVRQQQALLLFISYLT